MSNYKNAETLDLAFWNFLWCFVAASYWILKLPAVSSSYIHGGRSLRICLEICYKINVYTVNHRNALWFHTDDCYMYLTAMPLIELCINEFGNIVFSLKGTIGIYRFCAIGGKFTISDTPGGMDNQDQAILWVSPGFYPPSILIPKTAKSKRIWACQICTLNMIF